MSGATQEPGKMDSPEWAMRVVSDSPKVSPPIRLWRRQKSAIA